MNFLKAQGLLFAILLSIVSCKETYELPVVLFGEEQLVKKISGFGIPEDTCKSFRTRVSFPKAINSIPEFKKSEFVEYCIQLDLDKEYSVHDLSINLGYIDTFYRIYWNGSLVGHTKKQEKNRDVLRIDKNVLIDIPIGQVQTENILSIQVQKMNSQNGTGGVFSGFPRMGLKEDLHSEKYIIDCYNLGKIVLYFSTALLFGILYLGKKSNLSYLYFSIFLFFSATYFGTRLELRFDWNANLVLWKKIEIFSLVFILPSFSFYLYSIIERNSKKTYPFTLLAIACCITLFYLYLNDLGKMFTFHFQYHLPYMLFVASSLVAIPIREFLKGNKRAMPVIVILAVPFLITILDLLNTRFQIFPNLYDKKISGDAITILVISMSIYLSYQYNQLQKSLEATIEKERNVRNAFQMYVPPTEVERILDSFDPTKEEVDKGTLEEKIIFFCDIRDYTYLTESLGPTEIVKLLNSYFKVINQVIVNEGGVVGKLIGDCVMGWWEKGEEDKAIGTIFKIFDALKTLNQERKKSKKPPIRNGIGIASGKVVVGNIGSSSKMDYTLIGDPVNLASRIESLTKYYKISAIVTEDVVLKSNSKFRFREIDSIRTLGKRDVTKIFEPMGTV